MNQYSLRADLFACGDAELVRTRSFDALTCFLVPPAGAAPCVEEALPPVPGAAPLPANCPEPEPAAFLRSSARVSSLMYASPGLRMASVCPFLRTITDLDPVRTAPGLGSGFIFVLTFIL